MSHKYAKAAFVGTNENNCMLDSLKHENL